MGSGRSSSRRQVLQALASVAVAATIRVPEAHAARRRRIGILEPYPRGHERSIADRLALAMRKLGFVEGKDVEYLHRAAKAEEEAAFIKEMEDLAVALARAGPDAMVANGTLAATALARATSTIPIVVNMGDPVGAGLAKSLAKPGGNVTGIALASPEVYAKAFELLKAIIPGSWGLAFVEGESATASGSLARAVESGARLSGIPVHRMSFEGKSAADVDRALAAMPARGIRAISVWGSMPGIPDEDLGVFARYGLVHVPSSPEDVSRGNLLSYHAQDADMETRRATQLVRILRGMPPREIPFELASKFSLAINARTARTQGWVVPPSVLLRADQVFE